MQGDSESREKQFGEQLTSLFKGYDGQAFSIRLWDGRQWNSPQGRSECTLVIRSPEALASTCGSADEVTLGEAFIHGDLDVEGDLFSAFSVAEYLVRRPRNLRQRAVEKLLSNTLSIRRCISDGLKHSKSRDQASISYHYDLPAEFFRPWLGETLAYSCAYFRHFEDSLDRAQAQKLELICRKLRLKPGERLLDIGCGWGGLIMHAAKNYGVDATGITLSENQAALARERIEAAGLGDRCRVAIRDYRTLAEGDNYDKISSVGMVEHVGLSHLPVYFESAYRALKPGGLFMNHGIVSLGEARPRSIKENIFRKFWKADAFIDKYVFPDGKLTATKDVIGAAEATGFEVRDVESLREHYAVTLRHWVKSLEEKSEEATALVGKHTLRVWRLYMAASANAFATAAINILQTLLAKPDERGRSNIPMTRADLYS